MRPAGFLVALLLAAFAAAPASAAFQYYVFREFGVAKEFPLEPTRREAEYRTPLLGRAVPATIFETTEDNMVYRFTVADMRAVDLVARSAGLYAECIAMAEAEGKVLARMPQRVEDGTAFRVYGQLTSVDLAEAGGRKQTNCFLNKGWLYKVESIVLPARGEPNAAAALRFSTSLRFRIDQAPDSP